MLKASILIAALTLGGCASYQRDERLVAATLRGDFGAARLATQGAASADLSDRGYMLDRLKALILTLAEGVPDSAGAYADGVYEVLRTQGLNADRTVPSFFLGEGGVRVWKGEPFEQAMGYTYVAVYEAARGNWGNARAAANNSIFLLRDFSGALRGRAGGDPLAERQRLIEIAQARGDTDRVDSLGVDYRPVASDFELGYALKALAARAAGDSAEANEACAQLASVAPRLAPLAEQIRAGPYNVVLVVDVGVGPAKVAAGPDGAIALFQPTMRSDDAPLVVRVAGGGAGQSFPLLTDLNRLAQDLRWNNLEDLRLAKSAIGSAMLAGGLVTAGVTAGDNNPTAALVGLGVAAVGALLKGTSAADTRHCEVMPQRVYVALLDLRQARSTVELSVAGTPVRLVLPDVPAPADGRLLLRYVRVPQSPDAWTSAGRSLYASDDGPGAGRPQLPWVLGGRDVRTPSPQVMQDYYAAGLPRDVTSGDLSALYREEGVRIVAENPTGPFGRHILEGGDALYSPQAGTAGYARLFAQEHPAYRPRSPRLHALAQRLASEGVRGGAPAR